MQMRPSRRRNWTSELPAATRWLLAACCVLLAGCQGTLAGPTPGARPATASQGPTTTPQPVPQPSAVAPKEGIASLLSGGAQPLREASADLDADGKEEVVVLAAVGASPARLAAERLELFVFAPADEGHSLVWRSGELLGERAEPLLVEDVNRDGRPEIVSVQAMGAAGETMYVFAWLGDRYGVLAPHGGYFDGRPSFGETGARLGDDDGVPEIHATYGPAASETAVYRWDGKKYAIVEEDKAVGVQLALRVDRGEYVAGQPVRFTFTASNRGSAPLTFHFRSGQRFDIAVADAQGAQVWQWSHDRLFTQVLGTLTLEAGESTSFEATWDQRDTRGALVPPGRYRASAWLATADESGRARVEFDIRAPR